MKKKKTLTENIIAGIGVFLCLCNMASNSGMCPFLADANISLEIEIIAQHRVNLC